MYKVLRQLAQPFPAEICVAIIGVEVDDWENDPRGFVREVGVVIFQHVLNSITRDVAVIEAVEHMAKAYEDNALGKLSDEHYVKYTHAYEEEQRQLSVTVAEGREKLENTEQQSVDMRLLIKTLRETTDVKELTPTLVNSLIRRIEVHNNDKYDGHCHVKVDIYFTAVGMISIPTEKEILAMMEEIRKDPQKYKLVA